MQDSIAPLERIRKYIHEKRRGEIEAQSKYLKLQQLVPNIPSDPDLFYQDVGLYEHPRTKEPVPHLTIYQREFNETINRYLYAMAVKSNKIGLSTSVLDNLLYHMVTDCAGYQALILAQNARLSKEHITSLTHRLMGSEKYRDFLISVRDRDVFVMRGEATRMTEMYIRNPWNPSKPTRIISIPASAGNAVSWKEVKYVMCSDITMTDKDYDPVVKAAFTRLAQTRGYFVIETIPNGPRGEVYNIWLRNVAQGGNDFQVKMYPVILAVQADVIQEDFLVEERARHGPDFARLYECSFAATGGNVFNIYDIDRCTVNSDVYDPWDTEFIHNINYPKAMGIDIGHRVSQAGIVILQMRNGFIEVLDATQVKESNAWVVNYAYDQMMRFNIENAFVDSAASPFISDFKGKINENAYVMMTDIVNVPTTAERIVPVPFYPLNKPMLIHANNMVANGHLRIHESFKDLINQMKMATHYDGKLIKNKSNDLTLDLLDALFMALLRYGFELEREK